jgi:hypothetical protein
VESVYKWIDNGLKWLEFAVYIAGVKLLKVWVEMVGCTLMAVGRAILMNWAVYDCALFTTPSTHKLYTFFTQA